MAAENLVLGRGKMYFAPYFPNTQTGGTKGYFGNTPELTMAVATTKLDHYSSEQGLKVKDRSVQLQADLTLTFSTDNISPANLALWFGGKNAGTQPIDAPTDLGTLTLIGSSSQIYGALFFESDNPVGQNTNYWFPYVALTPNGNFALKGDAWQTLSFTGEALKRDAQTERFYAYLPTSGTSTAAADINPTYLSTDSVAFAAGRHPGDHGHRHVGRHGGSRRSGSDRLHQHGRQRFVVAVPQRHGARRQRRSGDRQQRFGEHDRAVGRHIHRQGVQQPAGQRHGHRDLGLDHRQLRRQWFQRGLGCQLGRVESAGWNGDVSPRFHVNSRRAQWG